MAIHWFPGHMTKARRQIEDKLKLIDVVIELLDSRLPLSSRNPMIDDILRDKPRLIILNKADLADPEITRKWLAYFKEQGHVAHPVDASTGTGVKEIPEQVKLLLKEKIDRQIARGMNPRAMRALIVGIPNVGKSTLINRMAGKSIAATGDRPGVTKGQQWIKTGGNLELLDTPGILWPKFEDQDVGYRLAVTGAIKEEILNIEDIAFYAVKYLVKDYGSRFQERFGIEKLPEDLENPDEIVAVMEAVGRKRGCLISGGRVDLEKASRALLHELRAGKLGRFTLETP
ncbi:MULTISPECIES: ribosome biogenesis GTPase YlqF [Paenibacillus]|jgi:ribosome biogenesis GTPase A|uniref:Ribosome biogenesis GTPase A n=1 Tax=Paenibacillus odorifer TaxID=189426 RepID=A0A1R0XPE9_9BACL|nr:MULTISPECIES: ribosome biogenesis GTPase YlqF [Paenibacillus]AIQ75107.1 GTPase [Paenibacillus odorifer]ETT45974.1 GTP-binding protein engA [Paenibacillus sp. FSL H8-237]MDH6428111.1 ribosome biogenesis GTPase A [Paenibacillus sp. PastH-4]MDH6444257.1 ribosome biogenesis GTPase A [Paenibacillus sp. PastF-4]MDH6528160.1 ribosome biogenesis GTPase A [Paenibacillus sp. PastH-3]